MVNRMRHTKGKSARRRAHHKVDVPAVTKDSETGGLRMRHRASESGVYRGRNVLEVKKEQMPAKEEKKSKK